MTRHHFLAGGGVEVATKGSTVGAATLWDPPGRASSRRLAGLLMMPGFIWAFRSRMSVAQQVGELMKPNIPRSRTGISR